MGLNFSRKLSAVGFLILTVAVVPANAGQISRVCSAPSTGGAPTVIASYSSGASLGICYSVSVDKSGTDKAPDYNIYSRGSAFTLHSSDVPSHYSYAAYDLLAPCLRSCPSSAPDALAIANKRPGTTKNIANTSGKPKPATDNTTKKDGSDPSKTAANPDPKSTPKPDDKTNTNTAANNDKVDPNTAAILQSQEEGKTQTDVTTAADGTITKKSYVDSNGDHKLSDDEAVTSTVIGKKVNGQFVVSQVITPADATKNNSAFNFTDKDGTQHTFYNANEAKAWAKDNAVGSGTYTSKDGKTTEINADGSKFSAAADKKKKEVADMNDQQKADYKKDMTDPCSVSARIGHEEGHNKDFRCQKTQSWAQGAEVANQVLTTAGRTVVNQLGATSAAKAQNGTAADAQDGAAKMAKASGGYETILGVANLAATVKLSQFAKKHKNAVGDLKTWQDGEVAKGNAFDGSIQASADSKARYDEAIKEQTGARNLASAAAFKTAMQAAQSLSGAMVSHKIAKDAKSSAALMRANDSKAAALQFQYDQNGLTNPNGVMNGYDPNVMGATAGTGSQSAGSSSTDNVNPNAPKGPLLGVGNDAGGDNGINAPVAGAFKEGAAGGSPGGGGGGGAAPGAAGGGAAAGGPTGQDEAKAAYASEFGTKERFENGGGVAAGAKGGGAGTKGADPGIDLNGLLAQFLPKGEDEASKHSIIDSVAFGGQRNLANEEAPSYLDKNADLFQRIHETMSEKNRRGQLGI